MTKQTNTSSNIPQLRFPEFEGEWETKKLEEKATFSKGKGISKKDIAEKGKTPCIRYGELYTVYNEVIAEIASKTNLETKQLIFSQSNDVIIPSSGESMIDIATASCVLKDGIALGGDLNIIRSKLNGVFLSYYLNSAKKYDIAKLAQGVSVVHLYSSQLKKLKISVPKNEEQQKIAQFLITIDTKIQQLTQKKTLLQQYKKGVMQQIFSQQIRLEQEDGTDFPDWEEKKLLTLADIKTGNKDTKDKNDSGLYPFFVRSNRVERIHSYAHDGEAVLTSGDGVGVGRNFHYINGKFNFHQRVYCIYNFKNELNGKYFHLFFSKYFYKRVIRLSAKNSVDSVRRAMITDMSIPVPSIKEQQKIANFLTAIDQKISQVNNQIILTENYKKGLLQQLFV